MVPQGTGCRVQPCTRTYDGTKQEAYCTATNTQHHQTRAICNCVVHETYTPVLPTGCPSTALTCVSCLFPHLLLSLPRIPQWTTWLVACGSDWWGRVPWVAPLQAVVGRRPPGKFTAVPREVVYTSTLLIELQQSSLVYQVIKFQVKLSRHLFET